MQLLQVGERSSEVWNRSTPYAVPALPTELVSVDIPAIPGATMPKFVEGERFPYGLLYRR